MRRNTLINSKIHVSYLSLLILFAAMSTMMACSTTTNKTLVSTFDVDVNRVRTDEEKKWGIRALGVRTTMKGMMIDFRYKIIEPKKAALLLALKSKAQLIVEKSGAKLGVPNSVKVGALRQTTHPDKVIAGRNYFVLFGNPGARLAKPGDKVTVMIGDFKMKNLTIN